jgi:hypothetical protein
MLDNKKIYLSRISEDWGERPESSICLAILEYLSSTSSQNISHLTYLRLSQIANSGQVDAALLKSIQYLCGDRVPLLEIKFELIEYDNHYQINSSEIRNAETTNYLIHPKTGEVIESYKDKVSIYFTPINHHFEQPE